MEDWQILKLFNERSETAISEMAAKYGKYCHTIAYNILANAEDTEECVNDTYLKAWEAIPPQAPKKLSAFLGKITRNLALDKYRYYNREKRNSGETVLALDELSECIPTENSVEQSISDKHLEEVLNRFLETLAVQKRKIFMQRYWYLRSIKEIAGEFAMSESKVKMTLLRTRSKLKQFLEKEGIYL